MPDRGLTHILRAIRRTPPPPAGDGPLLARFLRTRDEAAFAALVRRHGPMVYGVCRRVLGHAQDAEDAFQAAFLVLARKAGSVAKRESVGAWLYGVAYRTALDARAAIARRRARERQVEELPHPAGGPTEPEDWRPLLDRELSRLPEIYRAAVVLCDLEGRPRAEAARRLGVPEGTLSSRLAAARRTLARRLARSGVAVSGAAMAAEGVARAASCPWHTAAVPAALISATVRAAALVAAGNLAAAPAAAAALAKGALRAMWMPKLKAAAAVLALAATIGAGGLIYRGAGGSAAEAADPPAAPADADALRKENELLKLNLQTVLEKLRADEAAKTGESKPDGDEAARRFAPVAARFKYKVPFEIGETYFKDDARIEILEVWGTKPEVKIGGQYIVRGKYVMPSGDGKLYFHATATATGPGWDGTGPEMDCQYTTVKKGQGEFTLMHGLGGPGAFHLTLTPEDYTPLADVYFGTGDNVYRKAKSDH
jgi:RNA polymerase sigma factor (sigma-70 family)